MGSSKITTDRQGTRDVKPLRYNVKRTGSQLVSVTRIVNDLSFSMTDRDRLVLRDGIDMVGRQRKG